ncbi:unnamed protein product [Cylicocyclus nassatus]|uniref:Prominin-like protein n=1 Tax=Cylicocyclus nassatus TaxID=53992 RepID=A0AA36M3P2_CYLNA|nr:unnamed protein product [Cylicocyclus nassatus]
MVDAECKPPPAVEPMNKTHMKSFLDPYLYATSAFMKIMVNLADESHIEILARAVQKKATANEIFWKVVVEDIPLILIFLLGFVIAFVLLITCIAVFICRWRSPPSNPPANSKIWLAVFFLTVCAIVTIVCLVLIGASASAISDGLEYLPEQLSKSTTAVEKFVQGLSQTLECNFKKEIKNLTDEILIAKHDILNKVEAVRKSLKYYDEKKKSIGKPIKALQLQTHDLIIANADSEPLNELVALMKAVEVSNDTLDRHALNLGLSELEKNVNAFADQRKAIDEAFRSVMNDTFKGIFPAVVEHLKTISALVDYTIVKNEFKTWIGIVAFGLIALPILLLILILFSLVLVVVRLFWNYAISNTHSSKRSFISHIGGEMMGFTGYIAMGLSVILFILTSLAFMLAFTAMMVCIGFFEDKDLRVFRVAEGVVRQKHMTVSIAEIFYKCKNDYTFFDAMDGSRLMAEDEIKNKIDMLLVRDAQRLIDRGILVLDGPSNYEVFMKNSEKLLDKSVLNRKTDKNLLTKIRNSLKTVKVQVKGLANAENAVIAKVRDITSKNFIHYISGINEKVLGTAQNLLVDLIDMSPRCDSIMAIWNDIGWYVCYLIARPLSGTWMAIVITAFSSVIIYRALFDATRFLKSYSETSESVS